MGSKICMNTSCGAKTTVQWKSGWELKSGQRADLCFTCGSAYDNLVYCDKFHLEESGWRDCSLCNKRLHCGCIASLSFIQLLDFGGVSCLNCPASHSALGNGISCESQRSRTYTNAVVDVHNTLLSKLDSDDIRNKNVLSMRNIIDTNVPRYLSHSHTDSTNGSFVQIKPDVKHSLGVGVGFSNLSQALNGPQPLYVQPNNDKTNAAFQDKHEPQIPSLNISLETSKFGLTFTNGIEEGEKSMSTSFQTPQRPRHILPKPPKSNIPKVSDVTTSPFPPSRVARPPTEGRLRNQLLPRYWPRITDQELRKLSGDLNSTIVPLFEKILSASDASRIGRLVLPKACAEAYFPPINQSEGLPLKIRDVKGKEWTFQFRFWPNNNSRMYVLEGVTHCIQSMQLQAGDTVTFSRIDPGGKLILGYRKASKSVEMQDPQTSSQNPIGDASGESFFADMAEGLFMASGLTSLQTTISGEKDNRMTTLPEQSNQGKENEDAQQQKVTSDKKRMRNIGSKSKRLLMNSEDVMELRLTWEETQDLLRPPPSVNPNIVKVEDFEFEEYSEPPVFGKMTFFTTQPSGGEEQWGQCDKCCKWRKLPADVLLPPTWSCAENVWDPSRSSCVAPQEMSSNELDTVFGARKELKRRRVGGEKEDEDGEGGEEALSSGLDALARAATLGEQQQQQEEEEPSSGGGATTRHPRHRPGCTCIVCIQPPSGKGRHKPSCVCNVCLTVKRRFKTLMMRKKKRLSERQQLQPHPLMLFTHKSQLIDCPTNAAAAAAAHIDLNSHPIRDEDASPSLPPNMGGGIPPENPNACLANLNLRDQLHALVVKDKEQFQQAAPDNEGAKDPAID